MVPAASGGHLSILKHLRSGPDPAHWSQLVTSAAVPHWDCLTWLLSADKPGGSCPYPDSILADVAQHHGLPGLQWCRQNLELPQAVWNWRVSFMAACLGDRAMLQWLRAQDPPVLWNTLVCAAAAGQRDMNVLHWPNDVDFPGHWNVETTAAAAGSDLGTLKWLRGQHPPCPWDEQCCLAAARAGDMETMIWLRAQHPPCPWTSECFSSCGRPAEC